MRRIVAAIVAAVLAGCASGAAPESDARSAFNEVDLEFVQMMIPHHDQAVLMADMVPRSEVSAAVLNLANQIRATQAPEIDEMRRILAAWGEVENPHAIHEAGDHTMHGLMSNDDLEALRSVTDARFERAWLEMMIAHHEGAITMAEQVLVDGTSERVRRLAETIITAQRDEIRQMNAIVDTL